MKKNNKVKTAHPTAAFIDLGSNSVRLLVVRLSANRSHTVLTRYKQMVRLGEGVFETGRLGDEAMERTLSALRGIADMCKGYGTDEIVAYATAAMRGASNSDVFTARAESETGIRLSVISGFEEARLIHLGVASGLEDAGDRRGLFVDIGGGSTEVAVGQGMKLLHLDSLRIGAVRVATRFPATVGPGPVPPTLYKDVRAYIKENTGESLKKLRALHPEFMVGSSGTVVNMTEIASRIKADKISRILTRKALAETAKRLCAATLEERRKFPGINPQRADIIVAGAAILQTLMKETGMDAIAASNRGLLEGMLVDYLDSNKKNSGANLVPAWEE